MSFQVQYTNTPLYSGSRPEFEDWVATLNSSVLSGYPDCAGKTPSQVLVESNQRSSYIQAETITGNTVIQTFSSQADYDQSIFDQFQANTPVTHMRKLYNEAYPMQVTVTKTTV